MRVLIRILRVFLFFVLFAFALNNQHEVALKWFFGHEWKAPMVFIVLAVFGLGCAFGASAMLPSWWRHRRAAHLARPPRKAPPTTLLSEAVSPAPLEPPPRDGL
jgi:uncharacterized integral membrane protein